MKKRAAIAARLCIPLLAAWTLVGCARAGHIQVLTPLSSGEANLPRRTVAIETEPPLPPADALQDFICSEGSEVFVE